MYYRPRLPTDLQAKAFKEWDFGKTTVADIQEFLDLFDWSIDYTSANMPYILQSNTGKTKRSREIMTTFWSRDIIAFVVGYTQAYLHMKGNME